MSNNNLSKKILQKIEESKIVPKTRIHFVAEEVAVWIVAIIPISVGVFSVATIIFRIVNIGPAVTAPHEHFEIILFTQLIPFLWVITLILFGFLAYFNLKYTKHGYRYRVSTLIGVVVTLSIVFGVLLYALGMGYLLDHTASRYVPSYRDAGEVNAGVWLAPGQGRIVGKIVSRQGNQQIILNDFEGQNWKVDISDISLQKQKLMNIAQPIRLLGTEGNNYTFVACDVLPWSIHGEGFFGGVEDRDSWVEILRESLTSHEINQDGVRINGCGGVQTEITSN